MSNYKSIKKIKSEMSVTNHHKLGLFEQKPLVLSAGYGKTIEIDHGNGKATQYAHLSRQDVRKGSRVQQGQRIGAVGSTGWSTGPHLHFEFRVNGTHQDPLRVAKASEAVVLDGASKPRFDEVVRSVRAKLEIAESLSAPVVAAR